ncbi:cation-binding protein [Brumimicrobium salinarum]|uniref:Cation-binding protein n=1 Tax=Brumimicrobium salinarum TaxID=2058658 RepID=A0A2I0R3F1_9FLAO|nr:hemerythrin domain-containing protein [Brumimicrobium salinarum]PKR81101.1 cation-binding protein [Brumimicrobium salinarum]
MSTKNKPLKRDSALIPFSREHHHSLLLGWKIRKGIANGVEIKRIKKYTDWFYKNHVKKHFEDEEKYIFPILGEEHELIKKALAEHRRLTRLFEETDEIEKSLHHIEEELERHIRFEERELFMAIQEVATSDELKKIESLHDELKFEENTKDVFWE